MSVIRGQSQHDKDGIWEMMWKVREFPLKGGNGAEAEKEGYCRAPWPAVHVQDADSQP